MKQSETEILYQTLYQQYQSNYPQMIFYCCFLQDDQALKVARHFQFQETAVAYKPVAYKE